MAPWFERFGHSLESMAYGKLLSNGDLVEHPDLKSMVLLGGFAPDPKNDVWVTEEGSYWRMVYACPSAQEVHVSCKVAPWAPRAWFGTTIYRGEIWILGGTPLNNEVWAGSNLTKAVKNGDVVWNMIWKQYGDSDSVTWSPRSGLAVASQFQTLSSEALGNDTQVIEYLYVFGGSSVSDPPTSRTTSQCVHRPSHAPSRTTGRVCRVA